MAETLQSGPKHLVVVGASAGGLEPLRAFFEALQSPGDAAFVVIQHLSPDYKSMMGELLGRSTKMNIHVVDENMPIEAGKIYLIPPAYNIFVRPDAHFELQPKIQGVVNLPIDIFATSAAQIFSNRLILVILSGTGSDGAQGVDAVKDAGGLCYAQSPESAQFDGMPNSALATGSIDWSGDATKLAERISATINGEALCGGDDLLPAHDPSPYERAALDDILRRLRGQFGIDFTDYKSNTIRRRIERRLETLNIPNLLAYADFVRSDDAELRILFQEFLIGVTSFFRDPAAFDMLKESLLELIRQKNDGDPLRVWIAGCSTGEEAYSVAILIHECLEETQKLLDVKIFATDAQQAYLDTAADGIYASSQCALMSKERLENYFQKTEENFRIKEIIRRYIIFAKHNMIYDAPFTKLDLVSCRNVLIYFNLSLQERVLKRFQYSLKENGLLFLGASESLGLLQREFFSLASNAKIYRVLRPGAVTIDALQTKPGQLAKLTADQSRDDRGRSVVERGRRTLLQEVAPPSLVLNERNEVLHVFGDVSEYVKLGIGDVSYDISRLVPGRVFAAIGALARTVSETGRAAQSAPIQNGNATSQTWFVLRLTPVAGAEGAEKVRLLSFIGRSGGIDKDVEDAAQSIDTGSASDAELEVMQRELLDARESLRNTVEELETSNEELQATNEELLASNEELQSTNEELQSVNEELYTVNSEYQEKIRILDRLNADLDTMTEATGIPSLFLNNKLEVSRFTGSLSGIFELRATDLGRSIGDFANKIGYNGLLDDAKKALATGQTKDVLWQTQTNKFIIRHVPYLDTATDTLSLVMMFLDVSAFERLDFLQTVIDSLPQHVAVLSSSGDITLVNQAWRRFALENGADPDAVSLGIPYLSVCSVDTVSEDYPSANIVAEKLKLVLDGKLDEFRLEYPCHSPNVERWFLMHARKLGETEGVVVSHIETTRWHDRAGSQ
jgi:two-component system CheB/CheR fusion protein